MTMFDQSPPTATAGLDPAVEDLETQTGELVGLGFEREAIERNQWFLRQRRIGQETLSVLGDISEGLYGDRTAWQQRPEQVPNADLPIAERQGVIGSEDFAVGADQRVERMFRDLAVRRQVEPGQFANFPETFADLEAGATDRVRTDLSEELADVEARIDNRSSPSVAGAGAEFVGMAGAAITDIEGLATLPLGAVGSSGSLGRTMLIEGLLGAGSEALAIPAYNAQAAFLGREAPDPVQHLLYGATFGAALPLAGRAASDGAGLVARGARATNRGLLAAVRRKGASELERGAAAAVGREEAAFDSAPAGIDAGAQADTLDAVEAAAARGAPLAPPPAAAAVNDPPNWPQIQAGIFAGESGGDYDALFGFSNRGGGPFASVQVTQMTVDQAIAFSQPRGTYGQWVKGKIGRVATPMGAYQIVGTTLRHAKREMGLTGSEVFDEAMQDRIGKWILQTQGTDAWEGYRGPRAPGSGTSAGSSRFVDFGPADGSGAGAFRTAVDDGELTADAEGFQVRVGDTEFSADWRAPRIDVGDVGVQPVTRAAVSDALQAYETAVRAVQDMDQGTPVAARRAATQAQSEAYARLTSLSGVAADTTFDDLPRADVPQLEAVTGAPGRLASEIEAGRSASELVESDEVAALVQGLPDRTRGRARPPGADVPAWRRDRQLALTQLREAGGNPDAIGDRVPLDRIVDAVDAERPTSAPVEASGFTAADPAGRAGNQPNVGADARDPSLFADPIDSPGVTAQLDQLERDLRQAVEADELADLELAPATEDAPAVTLADALEEIDQDAEFLEQLQICMPKGVVHG